MTEETKQKISRANKGREPWNKGKTGVYSKEHIEFLRQRQLGFKHTEETKEKLREMGRNISDETRKKRSRAMSGSKCWNWQGGITDENKLARKNIEYKLWREAVYKRDDWTCQECGEKGGRLNAHHIRPFSKHPELRTSIENGITLCKKCHDNKHKAKDNSGEEG